MSSNIQESHDEMFRKYAWDYFSVHAAQRLTTFQFFITLESAIVGGYIAFVSGGGEKSWLCILGVMLAGLAFVFYKLDGRTKGLIKNAEEALAYLDASHNFPDQNGLPHPLRLIDIDNEKKKLNNSKSLIKKTYSYSWCFNIVFASFSLLGCLFVWLAIFGNHAEVKDAAGKTLIIVNNVSRPENIQYNRGVK
jgi:hypothetical protein